MLLQFKTYAFGKSNLFFDQIKEKNRYLKKVNCKEKRKRKMFLNVKKVTIYNLRLVVFIR